LRRSAPRGPKPPPAEARHCGRAPQTSTRSYGSNRSSRILGMTERNHNPQNKSVRVQKNEKVRFGEN